MTLNPNPDLLRPLIAPFPPPGPQVQLAYRELHLAVNGTPEQKKTIGSPALLPRPWEPTTCTDPELRMQLWAWLDAVVVWLNHEYTWDVTGMIPTCWPSHPHLVHEVAVVADQRRRAATALSSDTLEEWHRYNLPAFLERMRGRMKAHCEEEHQGWPARSRHSQHTSQRYAEAREDLYARDVDALPRLRGSASRAGVQPAPPRLGLVDLDTGVIQDLPDDAD